MENKGNLCSIREYQGKGAIVLKNSGNSMKLYILYCFISKQRLFSYAVTDPVEGDNRVKSFLTSISVQRSDIALIEGDRNVRKSHGK